MKRLLLFTALLVGFVLSSRASTSKVRYRYWFDSDTTAVASGHSAASAWQMQVDVSSLREALHAIHLQVYDDEGNVSTTVTRHFLKTQLAEVPKRVVYWVDESTTPLATSDVTNGIVQLDVNALPNGIHFLHVQAQGERSSQPQTFGFYKIPNLSLMTAVSLYTWIDGVRQDPQSLPVGNGIVSWQVDVSKIEQGLHSMQIQIMGNNGLSSPMRQFYFYRVPTRNELKNVECFYSIDGGGEYRKAGQLQNGLYHFDIDVATLDDGPHQLTCMLTDGYDTNGSVITRYFIKTPVGGYGVKRYDYWLNDSMNQAQSVVLSKPADPLKLIDLLSVGHQSIRSSNFEFAVENNKPVIYARNDLHVRFSDVSGRFIDLAHTFIDPTVKQEIGEVATLNPGETKTALRPQKNEIVWYKVETLRGDSLCFKSDRACTIQIFSPTGEELKTASGDRSVGWTGIHAPADGIYYVAQHDMTATQGSTLAISYQHFDRYAIINYNVHTVGNGGASTITFVGNGFLELDSIYLVNNNRDAIKPKHVLYHSNTEVEVMFDFYGAELGNYDLVCEFEEGNRRIQDAVKIEDAKEMTLSLNVKHPSVFTRGTSVTYTFEVTNNGNSTAYQVPLEIYMFCSNPNEITHASFSKNVPTITTDWLDEVEGFDVEKKQIRQAFQNKGDLLHFATAFDSISNTYVKKAILMVNVPPSGKTTITLKLTSDQTIDLIACLPSEWVAYTPDATAMANYLSNRITVKEFLCCIKGEAECIMDAVSSIIGLVGSPLAGCVAGVIDNLLTVGYEVWCGEKLGGKSFGTAIWDLRLSIFNTLLGCSIGKIKEVGELFKTIVNGLSTGVDVFSTLWGCATTVAEKLRGETHCPFDKPKGGTSTPVVSVDPNEMRGYVAESGSKAIGANVERVNYTIEFENDPKLASASAHTIVVTDTLSNKTFDLASFAPTSVRIGEVSMQLDGEQNFVRTMDMRPTINAIAQVALDYDKKNGIAQWTFTSLDPMTMEPTDDPMQGILPVNNGGNGVGEASYDIRLKPGLADGQLVTARAGIKFDHEEVIMTPDWVNVIDLVPPTCRVTGAELVNDSTALVTVSGGDTRSGVWRYDVYAQYGVGSQWVKAASGVSADRPAQVRAYEGINHGFYAVMTDSAGNVEPKQPAREMTLDYFEPTGTTQLSLALAKGWNWISHNLNEHLAVTRLGSDVKRITGLTDEAIRDAQLGLTGTLTQLDPAQLYKVQSAKKTTVKLNGPLFNAGMIGIPLVSGWNWLGYPLSGTMTVSEALAALETTEGDCLLSQSGMAMYSGGKWSGTLTQLTPGQGYMLRVAHSQVLHYATPRASMRRTAPVMEASAELPDSWTADTHQYPNVMGLVARVFDGATPLESDRIAIAAFAGDECRGVSQPVDDCLMMNIGGRGGETLTYKVLDLTTGEVRTAHESSEMATAVVGSLVQPLNLHVGQWTGIDDMAAGEVSIAPRVTADGLVTVKATTGLLDAITVHNAAGLTVLMLENLGWEATIDLGDQPDGVYVITATTSAGKTITAKVVKRP